MQSKLFYKYSFLIFLLSANIFAENEGHPEHETEEVVSVVTKPFDINSIIVSPDSVAGLIYSCLHIDRNKYDHDLALGQFEAYKKIKKSLEKEAKIPEPKRSVMEKFRDFLTLDSIMLKKALEYDVYSLIEKYDTYIEAVLLRKNQKFNKFVTAIEAKDTKAIALAADAVDKQIIELTSEILSLSNVALNKNGNNNPYNVKGFIADVTTILSGRLQRLQATVRASAAGQIAKICRANGFGPKSS